VVMTDGRSPDVPTLEGVVVDQSPKENERIASGGVVRLTVSALTAAAPTLTGLDLTAALKALSEQRLTLGRTDSRYVADAKIDTIIAQDPAPGSRLAAGAAVNVTVARAAQLSDFKVGIYYVDVDGASKALANRLRTVVRKAGSEADLLARPRDFFVGRLMPTRNEIRYGAEPEAAAARELQLLLEKAGDFPPFARRVVRNSSERFISVFILPDPYADTVQQKRLLKQ
jgi:hypothetical protein